MFLSQDQKAPSAQVTSSPFSTDDPQKKSVSRCLSYFHFMDDLPQAPQHSDLERIGFSKKILFCALLWTLVGYSLLNVFFYAILYLNASQQKYIHVSSSISKIDMAKQYLQLTDSPESLQSWIASEITNVKTQSASELVLNLIRSIRNTPKPQMENTLNNALLGNPKWYIFLYTSQTSGNTLLERLTQGSDGNDLYWKEQIRNDELGAEKEEFLCRLLNVMLAKQGQIIHSISRFNGTIQVLTIYIGVLTLLLILRRRKMMRRIEKIMSRNISAGKELPTLERTRECVYQPLNYLISILPGLGFIGTVLGMGTSLLHADNLFSSVDKQGAIAEMTRQLGYAFDTTLVALIVSIILGALLTSVQTYESHLYFRSTEGKCTNGGQA